MDAINACFEICGTVAVIPSILAALRDRLVAGVSFITPMFFAVWGFWNIAYYGSLAQHYSAIAAVFLALTNTAYLILVFKFRVKS